MNQMIRDYQQTAMRYIDSLHEAGGDRLTGRRQAAARRFAELGFPHTRTEAWRYTGIEGLMQRGFELTERDEAFPRHAVMRRFLREPTAARLVFVDGRYQADLSDTGLAGVRVGSLREAVAVGDRQVLEAVGSLSGLGDHGFAALNLATLQDGAVIRVSAGVTVQQPIELLHLAGKGAAGRAMRPRHLVMLEADASANLVERYLALDGETAYFNNLVCEITLAERASLVHQRIQQESAQAYHLCDIHLGLQGKAHYQGINAAVGGVWSRTRIHCRFTDPGAGCELDGLYLAGEGQLTDFHLDVDHAAPHCDSRENFKGILHGGGKAVFDGLIQVREQAQKSNAHLSNANLMLSRRAEVDTKPQLQIYADDVQCSHGASVGRLDEQAMFYLRSRGFDKGQARRLLCLGFANEIVERFQSAPLREQLSEVIGQRLEE
ncbi:MAG: Fe-S cluster assembly protein SufD [Candidatus Thiodiazotropha sp. (ex Epidulcina cf. delphinae)]|nr:Fe-S cluster assembly protein SufD [Candidatus Thiodiazotropha sp. (ex Epidulcina cf. delphinae)]